MAHIKYKSKSSPIQTLTVGLRVSLSQPAKAGLRTVTAGRGFHPSSKIFRIYDLNFQNILKYLWIYYLSRINYIRKNLFFKYDKKCCEDKFHLKLRFNILK